MRAHLTKIFLVGFMVVGILLSNVSSSFSLVNPAYDYCTSKGYRLENVSEQEDRCIFPDESYCEINQFYNGVCGNNWVEPRLADIDGHMYESYIRDLVRLGVLNGYSDGTFRPDIAVTRAQMAKYIVLGFGFEIDLKASEFPDVAKDQFYPYIMTLRSKGIISGYSDGKYRPDEFVSKSQVSKFIALSIIKSGGHMSSISQNYYTDVPSNHEFAKYIYYLDSISQTEKVIPGETITRFGFNSTVSRALLARIVSVGRRIASPSDSLELRCVNYGGKWMASSKECQNISLSQCSVMGGSFDSCGSPCGRDHVGACITLCVATCYFNY
jgi:putative hemolysin